MCLVFVGLGWMFGASDTETQVAEAKTEEPAPPPPPAPLDLKNFGCSHGFMTLEGEVQNRTDQPINNLMAVAHYFTTKKEFVKSDTGMVEYQPLLPGQRSPFKVISTYNPAMDRCVVTFKTMFGGLIESD